MRRDKWVLCREQTYNDAVCKKGQTRGDIKHNLDHLSPRTRKIASTEINGTLFSLSNSIQGMSNLHWDHGRGKELKGPSLLYYLDQASTHLVMAATLFKSWLKVLSSLNARGSWSSLSSLPRASLFVAKRTEILLNIKH